MTTTDPTEPTTFPPINYPLVCGNFMVWEAARKREAERAKSLKPARIVNRRVRRMAGKAIGNLLQSIR